MRIPVLVLCLSASLITGCSWNGSADRAREEARQRDRARVDDDSAARKAGHAAYGVAQDAKHAAAVAGKKLWKAGKQAHEGWKDAEREQRDQKRQ